MTFKELAEAINALPPGEQQRQAAVWPPEGCPAASAVPVTGLGTTPTHIRALATVILTGKKPA